MNWDMYKEDLDPVLVKNFVEDSNLSLELLFLESQGNYTVLSKGRYKE